MGPLARPKLGQGSRIAALGRDPEELRIVSGREHDYLAGAPRRATRVGSIAQGQRRTARHVNFLKFAVREETQVTAIRRPEWAIPTLGSREWVGVIESNSRTHSWVAPPFLAANAIRRPSGEIACNV